MGVLAGMSLIKVFFVFVCLAPNAGELLSFNRCDGGHSRVGKEIWDEVKHMLSIDIAGRDMGRNLDPRSDSLEALRQVMNSQVLPDLDNAVKDCAFGVMSLIWLTLVAVDSEEGLERARYLQALADGLFFQFADLLEESTWPLEPVKYFSYRQLLGHERNDCGGSGLRVYVYNSTDLTRRRLLTGSGMMAAASHIHTYLEQSSCTTEDPESADLFFLPAYHGNQYDTFLAELSHAEKSDERFPYLTQRPSDHFFVVSANLPSWSDLAPLRNSMQLTVESWQTNEGIPRWSSRWKDIMIPGYIDRWRIDAMRAVNKPTEERGFVLLTCKGQGFACSPFPAFGRPT
ncbi:unnamed protein product [Durusdinium trenchii]|uniref:Exostosin GT47 domain-containing protein n=1 Tax=Durusdinium trenchii TaxID=1381693 RepID=A0ABP0Q3Y2_9DINO